MGMEFIRRNNRPQAAAAVSRPHEAAETETETDMGMEFLETLGQGGFGTVHRVRVPGEQEELACKLFEGQHVSFLDDIQQEIDIMCLLRSKATPLTPIVRMHAFHIATSPHDPQPSFITMDLCRGGSLLDLLAVRTRLPEHAAALVISSIAKALVFCHLQARVLHLDVKPANILFLRKDRLDSARLADFGLSEQLAGDEDCIYHKPGAVGTPGFLAPEAKAHGHYSAAADTWSLGAVLFRMLLGHNPQPQPAPGFEVDFKQEGDAWKSLSASARNLLQGMLCPDPDLRLTLPQVLCCPWVLLKGNTSILLSDAATPATSTTSSPMCAAPQPRALRCPPGFGKVGTKHPTTTSSTAAPTTTLLGAQLCGAPRPTTLPCPPGFEKVAMKINTTGGDQVLTKNMGPRPPAALRCPPGFEKVAMKINATAGDQPLSKNMAPRPPALPCPPGFEKVAMKINSTYCRRPAHEQDGPPPPSVIMIQGPS